MHRLRLALTVGFSSLVLLTAAAPGTAQTPRDSVVAAVNEFFRAMTAHDSEPTVLVHGPLAVVWAPYDIHRNREFVHCGVDAFTPR